MSKKIKKIKYSYRDPDRKGGVLNYTTDVIYRDKFPKTFGISDSAMRDGYTTDSVKIYMAKNNIELPKSKKEAEKMMKKALEEERIRSRTSIFCNILNSFVDVNYSPKNIKQAEPISKNIRVIVVGNGSSVLKYEFGDIIDSYDIVIRVNHCVTKGLEKHVGKKIDVWATTRLDYHKN